MGKAFLYGSGGGAGLNFDVKGYATEAELLAATPKANTVGLITETDITKWIFDFTEPAEPVNGMVWFQTGTSGTVKFNALKKNGIQVYPISAKQYVSGAWEEKTAKSYQGGAWVNWWDGTIYDAGNEYESITGGWIRKSNIIIRSGASSNGTATKKTDCLYVGSNASGSTGAFTTVNKIDLTDFSTITFESFGSYGGTVVAAHTFETGVLATAPAYAYISVSPYNLDVSALTGEHYITVAAENGVYTSFTNVKLT